MFRVLVTFASTCPELKHNNPEYPIAVVVITPEGKRKAPCECRSLREGIIYGNGVIAGAVACNGDLQRQWPVNVEIDPRLMRTE